ncbi:MAG: ParB/RepB/Spo0J family partition protein [Candidatus Heimdallarchaeaceae archaeon]
MKIKKIPIDDLLPTEENPNKMKNRKFDVLVKTIEEVGYDQPIKVWWNKDLKKYEIVKGNHRYWAMKLLGKKEVDCVIGDYKNREEMLKDLVRDNVVRGEIDPVKFTELFNKLGEKYQKEELKLMMGFVDEAEFKRLYKEIREALPSEEMKRRLDETKQEIRTIDDLSIVLNKLFAEYGDELRYNFMIFSYSNWEEQIYIRANKKNWQKIKEIVKICKDKGLDINEVIKIDIQDLSTKDSLDKNKKV